MEERDIQARTPPHAPEAERSVLGSMLLEPNALELASEQLRAEDFYIPANETIFTSMIRIRLAGNAVDLVTLSSDLESHGMLERAGGLTYLSDLMSFVPSAANVQNYIDIVAGKSIQRRLIRAGSEIMQDGMNDEKNLEETLNDAERRIYDISMRNANDALVPLESIVPAAFNEIGELMSRKGKITGVASGFPDLDRMTNGFQKSDLVVIAGRPAMGKTSFAVNIAQYAALHDERTVAVFSMEMSAEQLVMRMLCTEASVESQRIKEGLMEDAELTRLMEVMDPMSRASLYIDDTGNLTVPEIRSKCRRLKARTGLDLVVIDYMQLMQSASSRRSDSRMAEISEITRSLKLLARELDVPILLLSQLNRGPETRQDHTPMISDLRESGSIEQDADMVILLYRPQVYDETLDNTSEIIIAKHRHGPTGTVQLVWQGEFTRFRNLAREFQS